MLILAFTTQQQAEQTSAVIPVYYSLDGLDYIFSNNINYVIFKQIYCWDSMT